MLRQVSREPKFQTLAAEPTYQPHTTLHTPPLSQNTYITTPMKGWSGVIASIFCRQLRLAVAVVLRANIYLSWPLPSHSFLSSSLRTIYAIGYAPTTVHPNGLPFLITERLKASIRSAFLLLPAPSS